MYYSLKDFLQKYKKLKNREWLFIKALAKTQKYKKGEIIHYAGEVCNKICFVNSGLLRGYIIDSKGKEYTWHIFFNDKYSKVSNLLVTDYDSFINKTPSKITIEVVKDCELLCFDREKLDIFFSTKLGSTIGLKLTQEAYSILHNYVISYGTQTAKERLETFMSHSSHWFDLIPKHQIATHLGITPQSLSRLKANYNGKKS